MRHWVLFHPTTYYFSLTDPFFLLFGRPQSERNIVPDSVLFLAKCQPAWQHRRDLVYESNLYNFSGMVLLWRPIPATG